jgi:hypothetical protein
VCGTGLVFREGSPHEKFFLNCDRTISFNFENALSVKQQRPTRILPPGADKTKRDDVDQFAGLLVAGAGFAAGFGPGFAAGLGAEVVAVVAGAAAGVKACDAAVVPPCTPNCPPVPRPPLTS